MKDDTLRLVATDSYRLAIRDLIPDRLRSRASSFITIGGLAAVPAGMGLAGTAADTYGTRTVLSTGAGWVLISTLVAVAVPSPRRLTAGS